MVDINIPKIVKSYVPLHRSTPLRKYADLVSFSIKKETTFKLKIALKLKSSLFKK